MYVCEYICIYIFIYIHICTYIYLRPPCDGYACDDEWHHISDSFRISSQINNQSCHTSTRHVTLTRLTHSNECHHITESCYISIHTPVSHVTHDESCHTSTRDATPTRRARDACRAETWLDESYHVSSRVTVTWLVNVGSDSVLCELMRYASMMSNGT